MKIRIKSLGIINDAKLEIGGLTVLCGKNNTGKTYVTHAIFGLLDQIRKSIPKNVLERVIYRVEREGSTAFSDADLMHIVQSDVDGISKSAFKILPAILAADEKRLQNARIEMQIISPVLQLATVGESMQYPAHGIKYQVKGTPLGSYEFNAVDSSTPQSAKEKEEVRVGKDFLRHEFARRVQSLYVPKVFICSAERTGAAIFQRELDFTRSRLVDLMVNAKIGKALPFDFVGKFVAEYPLAVRSDVDFMREFPSWYNRKSDWAKSNDWLINEFSDIIGGEYVASDEGIRFIPRTGKKDNVKLKLSESSSSVRALLDLAGYLKSMAKIGDLLIIDEPEMNLHPENQRRLARLLAALVNSGLNVFITTHSDYIVKEFNLLLMLNTDDARKKGLGSKYGYRAESLLDVRETHFYVTSPDKENASRMNVLPVTATQEGGIDKSSFDETIDSMNRLFDELYWGA